MLRILVGVMVQGETLVLGSWQMLRRRWRLILINSGLVYFLNVLITYFFFHSLKQLAMQTH